MALTQGEALEHPLGTRVAKDTSVDLQQDIPEDLGLGVLLPLTL